MVYSLHNILSMKFFNSYTLCLGIVFLSLCSQQVKGQDSITNDRTAIDSVQLIAALDSAKLFSAMADGVATNTPQEAILKYKKAIRLMAGRDKDFEANLRYKIAPLQYWLNNPEYLSQLNKAKSLYLSTRNFTGYTEVCLEHIRLMGIDDQETASIKAYNDLYSVQSKNGEAVLAGNSASWLARYYFKKSDYKQALNYADIAKNEYDKVCRRDSLGSIYFTIAEIKKAQKNEKAAEYYIISKALPYFSASDSFHGRINCFNFLAKMYMDKKKFSQAKWFYLQAYTQADAINNTFETVKALQNLVVLKTVNGNYVLAKRDWAKLISLTTNNEYTPQFEAFTKQYPSLLKKMNTGGGAKTKSAQTNINTKNKPESLVVAD